MTGRTHIDVPGWVRFTGWRAVDRRLFRHAWMRDEALAAELAGRVPAKPGWSVSRGVVTAVAVLVQLVAIGALVAGVWLSSRHFPGVGLLPGVVLLAFGALLLPRPAGLPRYATRLRHGDAPHLFAFVTTVAAEIGVRCPDLIVVDDEFAADGGTAGLLRRRHLRLGVPLLAALDAQQRAAVVAHQLAHFTDGDPVRGPLVGSVDRSLTALVTLFEPRRDTALRAWQDPAILKAQAGVGSASNTIAIVWYAELLIRPVIAVLRWAAVLVRFLVFSLVRADVHRAEYHADADAARVAGTAAVLDAFDVMALREPVLTVLRSSVRAAGDDRPRSAGVACRRAGRAGERDRPAAAVRLAVRRPSAPRPPGPGPGHALPAVAALTFTEADCAAVDADLAAGYRRFARDLRLG